MLLSEFENEHDFLDRIQIRAIDHSANVTVGVSPAGEILTYTQPSPPVSAIDDNNRNVKTLINSIDGNYYQGYSGSYITLNFGDELDVSDGVKLVIRSDLWYPKPPRLYSNNESGWRMEDSGHHLYAEILVHRCH